MRIALIEPYDTGSHHAWVRGYARASRHAVEPLTLPGAFWKWRMHGGAVALARRFAERSLQPDLILASDMLDLTTFLALLRREVAHTPVALYMHENQLTYPLRPGETRDLHYAFINYASMLCAGRIYFNSQHHLDAWFEELPRLLKHFPDHNELHTVDALRERSRVLPLGLGLAALDAHRPTGLPSGGPVILWNHRWEYDKSPEAFFAALYALCDRGADFGVAVLGKHFVRVPPVFEEARQRLGERILQFGYAESYAEYARWLWRADIAVSTAIHDFFGAAMVEAIYCGCLPILPDRLAYPEHIPAQARARCLYATQEELVDRLEAALAALAHGPLPSLRAAVQSYDWAQMAPRYDDELESLAAYAAGHTHDAR